MIMKSSIKRFSLTLLFSYCKEDKDNKADTTHHGTKVKLGNGVAQTFASLCALQR